MNILPCVCYILQRYLFLLKRWFSYTESTGTFCPPESELIILLCVDVFTVCQQIWDIRSDPCKCIKTLLPPGSSAIGSFISSMTQDSQINDFKINSAGTLLYAALGSTVRVWDLNT